MNMPWKVAVLAALAAGCNAPPGAMSPAATQEQQALVTYPTTAIADRSDTSLTVKVNATGQMSTSDTDTQSRLDALNRKLSPLSYDSAGNLRVASTGSSVVSGAVAVTNLPAVQVVTGGVEVENFPLTQNVNGNVAVTNFPPVQPVTGTIVVANMPTTQNVNGSVTVSNLPPTMPVTGSVAVSNLPAVQNVNITGGTVSSTIAPTKSELGSMYGAYNGLNVQNGDPYDLFYSATDVPVTLLTVSPGGTVRLSCWKADANGADGSLMLNLVVRNGTDFIHEFVHPLMAHKCGIVCLDSNGCQLEWAVAGL